MSAAGLSGSGLPTEDSETGKGLKADLKEDSALGPSDTCDGEGVCIVLGDMIGAGDKGVSWV